MPEKLYFKFMSAFKIVNMGEPVRFFCCRHINAPWRQVVEAMLVAGSTATVGFLMVYAFSECKPLGITNPDFPVQVCTFFSSSTYVKILLSH